jgi:hypothetical protein
LTPSCSETRSRGAEEFEPTGTHKKKKPRAELCAELGSPRKEPPAQRYVEQSHGVMREKKGR